jgi:PAS domain S-box-containing protein
MRTPSRRFSIPFNDLGVRLFCLALAVLVPAWIFACAFILESRALADRQLRADLVLITDLVRHNQLQLIDHTRALLMSIANEPLAKMPSSEAFSEKLAWALSSDPFLCNIGFIDPQGAVLSSAVPVHGKMYLGDRSYFQRTLVQQQFTVGLFQIGRITGRPTINFGYPVLDDNKRVGGVLFAALDLSWIQKFAQTTPLPPNSTISLVDSEGTIIARYPNNDKWVGKKTEAASFIKKIDAFSNGTVDAKGIDGEQRTYSYMPIKSLQPNPIYIGVGFSTVELLAPYTRFLVLALVGFVLSIFVSLFLARYLSSKWIVEPIVSVVNEAARLDPPLLAASAPTDLGAFSTAVGALASRVEQTETALKETRASLLQSEQRYQALVTRLPSVVWSADRDGKTLLVSPGVRRMLGFEVEEVMNNTLLHFDRVHDDDLSNVKSAYAALFNGDSFDLMYRMQHKSGQWIWVEDHATCLKDDKAVPVAYGVLSNLSERRRLEHEMFTS